MSRLCSLLFLVFSVTSTTAAGADRMPNIIILLADDLGWTGVSCFGSDLQETPSIDRLAERGMVFSDAYSACTVCSPTRASIMTGQYPARLHLTDFIAGQNRPFEKLKIPEWRKYLRLEEVTIAEALRFKGYSTAHVGKWHLEPRSPVGGLRADEFSPKAQGFEISVTKPELTRGYWLPEDYPRSDGRTGGFVTDYLTDEAVALIERYKSKPFFLYFAYHTPHTPIQGKPDLVEYYEDKLKKNPNALHRNPTYAAMIHSLDESVGRISKKLDELQLTENSVVIFTSDNGGLTQRYGKNDGIADNSPLRRGKGSAYEGGVRVPMIVQWPTVVKPGSRCSEPVMTIDFYPTALELAGYSGKPWPGGGIDGLSLVKLLHNGDETLDREALYWHYPHYHAGGDAPYSAVRSGEWRLIEFHDDTPTALYNLQHDLGEKENLAGSRPSELARLKGLLNDWRSAVGAQMPTVNTAYDPLKAGKPVSGSGPR